jgi:hypothetical protein
MNQDVLENPGLGDDKRTYAVSRKCDICDCKASFRIAEALQRYSGVVVAKHICFAEYS